MARRIGTHYFIVKAKKILCIFFLSYIGFTPLFAVCPIPSKRIVALAPHLSALMSEAGAAQDLIAVSAHSDDPHLPIVADYQGMNVEAIVALKPDCVLAWKEGSSLQDVDALKELGIPVWIISIQHIDDIPRVLRQLGKLTAHSSTADLHAAKFNDAISHIKKPKQRVRVFYQVWGEPLLTVTRRSMISEAITLCGGNNIFSNLQGIAPRVDPEAVFAKNPEVMIGDAPGWELPWLRFTQIDAVKHHRLYTLSPRDIEQPDTRMLNGILALCRDLSLARATTVS